MNTVLSVMFGESQKEDFSNIYHCHSFLMHNCSDIVRQSLRFGGKLLLPPSALRVLTTGPSDLVAGQTMTFSVTASDRCVLAGVHEFTAPETMVLAPDWLMRQLRIRDGDTVRVAEEVRQLPRGNSARLRAHNSFLEHVADPKTTLELLLQNFVCLSVGDEIEVEYEGCRYQLDIVDLRPRRQVCILNCDLNVEFEEDSRKQLPEAKAKPEPELVHQPAPAKASDSVPLSNQADKAMPLPQVQAPPAPSPLVNFPGVGIRADGFQTLSQPAASTSAWGTASTSASAGGATSTSASAWGAASTSASASSVTASTPASHSRKLQNRDVRPNMSYVWGSLTYLQHKRTANASTAVDLQAVDHSKFTAFSGHGSRLDGRTSGRSHVSEPPVVLNSVDYF